MWQCILQRALSEVKFSGLDQRAAAGPERERRNPKVLNSFPFLFVLTMWNVKSLHCTISFTKKSQAVTYNAYNNKQTALNRSIQHHNKLLNAEIM